MNYCTCAAFDGDNPFCRIHTGMLYQMLRLDGSLKRYKAIEAHCRALPDYPVTSVVTTAAERRAAAWADSILDERQANDEA